MSERIILADGTVLPRVLSNVSHRNTETWDVICAEAAMATGFKEEVKWLQAENERLKAENKRLKASNRQHRSDAQLTGIQPWVLRPHEIKQLEDDNV